MVLRRLFSCVYAVQLSLALVVACLVMVGLQAPAQGIVGGRADDPVRWPSLVMVFTSKRIDSQEGDMCTGTLIAPRWVLTAAHCVDKMKYVFIAQGRKNTDDPKANWTRADKTTVYSGYSSKRLEGDLALLKLPRAWKGWQPPSFVALQTGSLTQIMGWGSLKDNGAGAGIFRTAQSNLLSPSYCASKKDKSTGRDTVCTGGSTQNICSGDSGGPLWGRYNRRWILIGVASFNGKGSCNSSPAYYVNLSRYSVWIARTLLS